MREEPSSYVVIMRPLGQASSRGGSATSVGLTAYTPFVDTARLDALIPRRDAIVLELDKDAKHVENGPSWPRVLSQRFVVPLSTVCSHVRFQEVGRVFPFRGGGWHRPYGCAGQETGPEDAG